MTSSNIGTAAAIFVLPRIGERQDTVKTLSKIHPNHHPHETTPTPKCSRFLFSFSPCFNFFSSSCLPSFIFIFYILISNKNASLTDLPSLGVCFVLGVGRANRRSLFFPLPFTYWLRARDSHLKAPSVVLFLAVKWNNWNTSAMEAHAIVPDVVDVLPKEVIQVSASMNCKYAGRVLYNLNFCYLISLNFFVSSIQLVHAETGCLWAKSKTVLKLFCRVENLKKQDFAQGLRNRPSCLLIHTGVTFTWRERAGGEAGGGGGGHESGEDNLVSVLKRLSSALNTSGMGQIYKRRGA